MRMVSYPFVYLHDTNIDHFPAASQMTQQMGQMQPGAGANMFGPGQDPQKQFDGEAENIEVLAHDYLLNGIEERLLSSLKY
jgi:ER membrane protein complex subunit 3